MAEMTEPKSSLGHFLEEFPFYNGPLVKIKVTTRSKDEIKAELMVSKNLLCAESPVFTRMLNGNFKEAQEQTVELEEMEGVVSACGVRYFVSWLYQGLAKSDIKSITFVIELARFADLYMVTALELRIHDFIRTVILTAPFRQGPFPNDQNTFRLKSHHIISGLDLPRENSVRRLLAQASVEACLRSDRYQFKDLALEYPAYGSDLRREVHRALRNINGVRMLEDPIRKYRVRAKPKEGSQRYRGISKA